jgi:hypothetical protein
MVVLFLVFFWFLLLFQLINSFLTFLFFLRQPSAKIPVFSLALPIKTHEKEISR